MSLAPLFRRNHCHCTEHWKQRTKFYNRPQRVTSASSEVRHCYAYQLSTMSNVSPFESERKVKPHQTPHYADGVSSWHNFARGGGEKKFLTPSFRARNFAIWQDLGGQFALASPTPKFWGDASLRALHEGRRSQSIDSCKFLTQVIMGAQNFNFSTKLSTNGGFWPRILHLWTKIFRQFSDSPKFRGGKIVPLSLCLLCHDATEITTAHHSRIRRLVGPPLFAKQWLFTLHSLQVCRCQLGLTMSCPAFSASFPCKP